MSIDELYTSKIYMYIYAYIYTESNAYQLGFSNVDREVEADETSKCYLNDLMMEQHAGTYMYKYIKII